MNLRPRRQEDPEINLINMIDVLLVLLIFFMVSTTFNQEGRVKIQLPQSSDIPLPKGSREPVVITVTVPSPLLATYSFEASEFTARPQVCDPAGSVYVAAMALVATV